MRKNLLMLSIILAYGIGFSYSQDNTLEKISIPKEQILKIGEESSQKLLKTLKRALLKTIKEKSIYEAVKFCSQQAIPLTKKVEKEIDHGIKIKRTSLKYRNHKNAPDKYERKALLYFESLLKQNKKIPQYYIQKIEINNKKIYRYYKPLKINGICLTCHGNQKFMDKKLLKIIKTIYPKDKATGYKIGDFRGVISVSIPEELINKN